MGSTRLLVRYHPLLPHLLHVATALGTPMPATTRVSRRSTLLRSLTFAMALAIVAVGAPFGPARADAATAVIAGFRDFVYGDAPGGDDVTAGTVQSKLWYHDGRWFGILFDPTSTTNAKYRIWRFD